MDAWIGVIATLIGTAIGGWLTRFNTTHQMRLQAENTKQHMQLQVEKERKLLFLGKLEELHQTFIYLPQYS